MFGDTDGYEISDASMEVVFDTNTCALTYKFIGTYELEEGTGMTFDVPMKMTAKYSYTRKGTLIKYEYLDCDIEFGDITLNSKARAALAENGVSEDDVLNEMNKNKAETIREVKGEVEEEAKQVESNIIKSLEDNKLVLENKDGVSEYLRIK